MDASIVAPAVALPPPISYRQAIPYNIAPFAASISTFTKALSFPPFLPATPLSAPSALPPPAPFLPAPLTAGPGPLFPASLAAVRAPFVPGPALPAPLVASPFLPGPFPITARSIHPAGPFALPGAPYFARY